MASASATLPLALLRQLQLPAPPEAPPTGSLSIYCNRHDARALKRRRVLPDTQVRTQAIPHLHVPVTLRSYKQVIQSATLSPAGGIELSADTYH